MSRHASVVFLGALLAAPLGAQFELPGDPGKARPMESSFLSQDDAAGETQIGRAHV